MMGPRAAILEAGGRLGKESPRHPQTPRSSSFPWLGRNSGVTCFVRLFGGNPGMKRFVLASLMSLISLALAPVALAQSRGGDAALGAVSGAVVFGPVGAVAGAVVGYAAGPSIAHSWGFRRSGSRRVSREKSRGDTAPSRVSQNTATTAASPETTGTARASAPPRLAPSTPKLPAAPPVQGLE